jgi:hypothetical protein
VTASGLGSVLRDVKAGGRCYVPISSTANTHRTRPFSRSTGWIGSRCGEGAVAIVSMAMQRVAKSRQKPPPERMSLRIVRGMMAVFIRGREIGGVVMDMQERVSRAWVHVTFGLVGIAAFAVNFAGLFTPRPPRILREAGSR